MKLHIESLQERMETLNKEKDGTKKDIDKIKSDALSDSEKLNKIIKTLEADIISKGEKIKSHESKIKDSKIENHDIGDRLKALQVQYERLLQTNKHPNRNGSKNIEGGPPELAPDYHD